MDNNKKSPNEEQGYAEEQGKIDAKKLQFYENLRQKSREWTKEKTGTAGNKLAEYLFLLPDFFILVCRIAVDKRVPAHIKLKLAGIIAYVMMPLDLIPDFIPIMGSIDDLVLIVLGLNMILNDIDQQILEDNWSGEGEVLHWMQRITAEAENFLDRNILQKIKNFLKL